jgi:hypothetical protein
MKCVMSVGGSARPITQGLELGDRVEVSGATYSLFVSISHPAAGPAGISEQRHLD